MQWAPGRFVVLAQEVITFIWNGHAALVRVDGAERKVLRCCLTLSQNIEERWLSKITDESFRIMMFWHFISIAKNKQITKQDSLPLNTNLIVVVRGTQPNGIYVTPTPHLAAQQFQFSTKSQSGQSVAPVLVHLPSLEASVEKTTFALMHYIFKQTTTSNAALQLQNLFRSHAWILFYECNMFCIIKMPNNV